MAKRNPAASGVGCGKRFFSASRQPCSCRTGASNEHTSPIESFWDHQTSRRSEECSPPTRSPPSGPMRRFKIRCDRSVSAFAAQRVARRADQTYDTKTSRSKRRSGRPGWAKIGLGRGRYCAPAIRMKAANKEQATGAINRARSVAPWHPSPWRRQGRPQRPGRA